MGALSILGSINQSLNQKLFKLFKMEINVIDPKIPNYIFIYTYLIVILFSSVIVLLALNQLETNRRIQQLMSKN